MKRVRHFILVATATFLWVSCNSPEKKQETTEVENEESAMGKGEGLAIKVDNTIDPVCGMSIENNVKDTLKHEDKVYGFCSTSCKENFKASPQKYMEKIK